MSKWRVEKYDVEPQGEMRAHPDDLFDSEEGAIREAIYRLRLSSEYHHDKWLVLATKLEKMEERLDNLEEAKQ